MPDNIDLKTFIESLSDIVYILIHQCEGYSENNLKKSLSIIERNIRLNNIDKKIISELYLNGFSNIFFSEDMYIENMNENVTTVIKGPITLGKICSFIDNTCSEDYDYGVHTRFIKFSLVEKRKNKIYLKIWFERISTNE